MIRCTAETVGGVRMDAGAGVAAGGVLSAGGGDGVAAAVVVPRVAAAVCGRLLVGSTGGFVFAEEDAVPRLNSEVLICDAAGASVLLVADPALGFAVLGR